MHIKFNLFTQMYTMDFANFAENDYLFKISFTDLSLECWHMYDCHFCLKECLSKMYQALEAVV